MFSETLQSWQNFYFMTGGAAATLLGLMFVALSLGIHLVTKETREEIKTFVNPSVFYFVLALFLCCLMMIPNNNATALSLVLGLTGIVSLLKIFQYVWRIVQAALKHGDFDFNEWLFQAILPAVSPILMLGAALCFAIQQDGLAFMSMWLLIVCLQVAAIYNTWSLVMWIIQQRQD